MGKRRRRMIGRKRISASVIAAAVLATGAASQAADIAVIAGSAQDSFFNKVKKGVDDAALVVKANGGKVTYLTVPSYDNFGPDLVGLINTAVSQKVQGIAIPIWVPDAQVPALQEAVKKGIKIMMYNSGEENTPKVSGLNYFGTDEKLAGVAGGEYLAKLAQRRSFASFTCPEPSTWKPAATASRKARKPTARQSFACRCRRASTRTRPAPRRRSRPSC